MMIYKTFSKKQLITMLWWRMDKYKDHDAIICDGSVRSGKTLCMTIGFILWASSSFDGYSFAMCGKTIEAFRRNVITPMKQWIEGLDIKIVERLSENYLDITANGHTNRFYVFGGRDESSAAIIQGMTLAGIFLDETAIMPRSFVEMAVSRCSVKGSKFWFNCNPESPHHWFLKEWIEESTKKNALHLHFTMEDNYSLDLSVKKRYENLYNGVFYDRFILGRWVRAEGLIYPMFRADRHTTEPMPDDGYYYISIDYGTLNPFSAGLWCIANGKAYRIAEFYYDGRKKGSQKTDEEYYEELERLAGDKYIERIVIDPSAASMIECIRRHGRFKVRHADNDVLNGINRTAALLNSGMLQISPECKDCIREFGLYSWDEKAAERGDDRPIKQDDHAMDDVRYFVNTILRKEFKWCDWS